MRVPRIFQNQPLHAQARLMLDEHASRHLITVLRFEKGYKIILFNGQGEEYPADIIQIHKNRVEVEVRAIIAKNYESYLNLHVGQVITKGEKMDYLIQKATELGVTTISPILSTRTDVRLKGEREEKKREHWLRVMQSACEQCGRNVVPALQPMQKLFEWISYAEESTKIMLDHRAETALTEVPFGHSIALLVGPEGGLTFDEKLYAEQKGFLRVHLGPRVLRSETAGIAAITLIQALAGDLAKANSR